MKSPDGDDSCKSSFINQLKGEFRVNNLSLSFETNSDYSKKDPEEILEYFHSSMWPVLKKFKLVYVVYRIIIAVYYTAWFIESIISNIRYRADNFHITDKQKKNFLLLHPWPFYMTSWSLTMLTLHFWASAFIVLYFYSIDKNSSLNALFSYLFGPFSCTRQQKATINKNVIITSNNQENNTLLEKNKSESNKESVQINLENPHHENVVLELQTNAQISANPKSKNFNNRTLCNNQANCRLPSSIVITDTEKCKMWYKSHVPLFILCLIKLSWLLYNIVVISALLVTIGYFTHVNLAGLEVESTIIGEIGNFHRHGLNSVFALIDLILMAYPVRILHFVYTATYGWLYAFVIFVYWFQNPKDNKIYPQIDYAKPYEMIGLYITLSIITFMMQSFHFMAYRLKLFIRGKMCNC